MVGIVGLLSRDVVDGGPPRVGGAPYYCARALAALGRSGVIATKYAPSDADLARPLHALGLPTAWRPAKETIAFRLDNEGDRRTISIQNLGEGWGADEASGWVADALADVGWVHAGALTRSDFSSETLAELARDHALSLDGQGLVRPGRTGRLELDGDFDPEVLRYVQTVKLDEEEAEVLDWRTLGVPEIVVTLGPEGAVVNADGKEVHVPTRPLELADSTGAGDAFAAVYLTARENGNDPVDAAREANAAVHDLLHEWHGH